MNLTVFTGPSPAANIDKLFSRTPLRSGNICAVVPDSQSVAVMERRLADLLDSAYTGHRVYTFEGLSKAIISKSARVPETLGNHVRRALIGEIVKSRIGKQSRFYSISGYQGFVSLIGSFLEDIRSKKNRIISRDREIMSIADAYESNLNRLGTADHEGLIRTALSGGMIEHFAESFSGPLIVDGFYDLTEIQYELLSRLFNHFVRSEVTLVGGESNSSLFGLPSALKEKYIFLGAKIFDVEDESSFENRIHFSGFLKDDNHGIKDDGNIELHTFQSESSEADWISGRIRSMLISGEYCPEDIMIVSRNTPDFCNPIYRSLKRHGIPLEGGASQRLINHPFAGFVFDILDAAINPLEDSIAAVQRSCYTGRIMFDSDNNPRIYDDRAWSCMINEVDSPDGFISSMKNIFERLKVQSNLDGGGNRYTAVRENLIFGYVIEVLDDFAKFYSRFRPMLKNTEFRSLLRLFMSDITIPEAGSPGQGVLVHGVEYARNVERGIVFVKGFDNSSFPAGNERYSLHEPGMAAEIRKHKDMEEELLFFMSVSGAKKLILTFPGIDNEGDDSSISPYLKKIRAGMKSHLTPVFHKGIPGDAWEEGYVTECGKKENIIRALRNSGDSAVSILASLHGKTSELADVTVDAVKAYIRRTDETDISVTAAENCEILGREWGTAHVYSATALERYISCPVAFFFSDVIGLETERELTDSLDALEYGIITHDVLAEFYKSREQEFGRTTFSAEEISACKKRMDKIVDTAFHKRSREHSTINPIVIAAEMRFLKSWMHYIIDTEAEIFNDSPFMPYMFESSFGDSVESPFEICHEGKSIKLKGRIDRIDITEMNGIRYFRVIDYKSGKAPSGKDISEGKVIQLPLYIKAVLGQLLTDHQFESGIYYSLKKAQYDSRMKKLKGCTVIDSNFDEISLAAEKKAVESAHSIQNGEFAYPEKCSDYCEWISLCRGGRERSGEDDYAAE